MKIDMNEVTHVLNQLKSQRDNIDKELERAKKASDKIVESNALSGKVKEAIDAEINNHKIPLIEAYRDTNKEIVQEFKRVQNEFEKYVEESSNTAVIDTDALHDIARRLSLSERKLQETNREISRTLNSVRDIVSVSAPSLQNVEREYHATKKKLADIESKMDGFSGSYFKKVKISISSQNKKASEMGGVVKEGFKSKRILKIYEDESFRKNMRETSRTMQMDIIKYWTDSASEIFSNCKNIEDLLKSPEKIIDGISRKIDKQLSSSGEHLKKDCKEICVKDKVAMENISESSKLSNLVESKKVLDKCNKSLKKFKKNPYDYTKTYLKRNFKKNPKFAKANSILGSVQCKSHKIKKLATRFENILLKNDKIKRISSVYKETETTFKCKSLFFKKVDLTCSRISLEGLKVIYGTYKVGCDIQKFIENPFEKNSFKKDLVALKEKYKKIGEHAKNVKYDYTVKVKSISRGIKKTSIKAFSAIKMQVRKNEIKAGQALKYAIRKNVRVTKILKKTHEVLSENKVWKAGTALKKTLGKIGKSTENGVHKCVKSIKKIGTGVKLASQETFNAAKMKVQNVIKESFNNLLDKKSEIKIHILDKGAKSIGKVTSYLKKLPHMKVVLDNISSFLSKTKSFVGKIPVAGYILQGASVAWSVGSAFFDKSNKKTYHNFGNSVIHAGIDSLRDIGPADLAISLGFLGASLGPWFMVLCIGAGLIAGKENKSKTFKNMYNCIENTLEH